MSFIYGMRRQVPLYLTPYLSSWLLKRNMVAFWVIWITNLAWVALYSQINYTNIIKKLVVLFFQKGLFQLFQIGLTGRNQKKYHCCWNFIFMCIREGLVGGWPQLLIFVLVELKEACTSNFSFLGSFSGTSHWRSGWIRGWAWQ